MKNTANLSKIICTVDGESLQWIHEKIKIQQEMLQKL